MRHAPNEYYVKYLCSIPGIRTSRVQSILKESGMEMLPYKGYVDDLYAEIQGSFPNNYNPRDISHKPSRNFLKEHRIRGMWHPTRAVREATDVFANGPLREVVESLILTGLNNERVALLVSTVAKSAITPNAIAEYKHYFWNTDLLTYQDWTEYLSQPSIEPVRLAALKSPNNMDGVRLTLYKLNIMPKKLDKREIFTSVRDIGFMNLLEANGFPQGFRKAEMLSGYAGMIKGAQQQLDEYEAGEQDVIQEFYKRMTLKSRDVEHKTYEELTGESLDGEGSVRKLTDGKS